MKTFVTLFNTENFHLIKDVGLVPYGMSRFFGWDSSIVSFENGEYPYLESEVKGLNIKFIPKIMNNWGISSALYLIKNARKIDVLNVYHTIKSSVANVLLYKALNPQGIAYVKLDGTFIDFDEVPRFLKWSYRRFVQCVDIFSTETQKQAELLSNEWGRKVCYITNSILPEEFCVNLTGLNKKNIILTVGRLGTEQKATEILVEAFEKALNQIEDTWTLELVGTMTEKFQVWIKKKMESSSQLRERIFLTGNIVNREQLINEYGNAKLFCMPSRWEGFPLAVIEASAQGDVIIATGLEAMEEITGNWKHGYRMSMDNVEELSQIIVNLCNNSRLILENSEKQYRYTKKNHSLYATSKKLKEAIDEL